MLHSEQRDSIRFDVQNRRREYDDNRNDESEKHISEGMIYVLSHPPAQFQVHPQRKRRSQVELCKMLSSPVAKPQATNNKKK